MEVNQKLLKASPCKLFSMGRGGCLGYGTPIARAPAAWLALEVGWLHAQEELGAGGGAVDPA